MNLPTQLTLLRILLTPIFVSLLFIENSYFKWASFFVFAMASLTDYYDGYTARKYGVSTVLGEFLDPLADKILVSSALISFNALGYVPSWIVLVIVARDFFITGFRSYAILKGKPIVTHRLAKVKTYIQIVVLYFIYLYHVISWSTAGAWWQKVVQWVEEVNFIFALLICITLLTVLTGLLYLIENWSSLKQMALSIYRIFVPSDG